MKISQLKRKWEQNKEYYKTQEIGTGVQSFVKDILESEELFNLKEAEFWTKEEERKNEFIQEQPTKAGRQADFVIFIDAKIEIPLEVKCFTHIEEGRKQLENYQKDLDKKYGILTDGYTWRFYKNNIYEKFNLEVIFTNPEAFLEVWKDYIQHEFYYFLRTFW